MYMTVSYSSCVVENRNEALVGGVPVLFYFIVTDTNDNIKSSGIKQSDGKYIRIFTPELCLF